MRNAGTRAWTRLKAWWNQRRCDATHQCGKHGRLRCRRRRGHTGEHAASIYEWNETGVWSGRARPTRAAKRARATARTVAESGSPP